MRNRPYICIYIYILAWTCAYPYIHASFQSKPLSFFGESTHCYCTTKQAIDQNPYRFSTISHSKPQKETRFPSKPLSFFDNRRQYWCKAKQAIDPNPDRVSMISYTLPQMLAACGGIVQKKNLSFYGDLALNS